MVLTSKHQHENAGPKERGTKRTSPSPPPPNGTSMRMRNKLIPPGVPDAVWAESLCSNQDWFCQWHRDFGRINSKPGGPKKDYRNKTVHTHGLLDQNVRFETLQKATGSTSETYSEQLGGEFPCRHWDWMLFLELILCERDFHKANRIFMSQGSPWLLLGRR